MGDVRRSCVRGRFYPHSAEECVDEISRYSDASGACELSDTPIAGIVPHAGWVFSGPTAGKVFATIKKKFDPETFVVFGAVHRRVSDEPIVMVAGEWETPLGNVLVDSELAMLIIEKLDTDITTGTEPHEMEHSIEVQVPFIKHLFPDARLVPILVPPTENAAELGRLAGTVASKKAGTVFIGSTDLTHYGPEYGFAPKGTGEEALKWVREVNDKKIVDLMCEMKAEKIVDEARQHHNACGSGAVAATVAAAAVCGKTSGSLVEYVTSHDVMPRGEPSMFVGYAGIVF